MQLRSPGRFFHAKRHHFSPLRRVSLYDSRRPAPECPCVPELHYLSSLPAAGTSGETLRVIKSLARSARKGKFVTFINGIIPPRRARPRSAPLASVYHAAERDICRGTDPAKYARRRAAFFPRTRVSRVSSLSSLSLYSLSFFSHRRGNAARNRLGNSTDHTTLAK